MARLKFKNPGAGIAFFARIVVLLPCLLLFTACSTSSVQQDAAANNAVKEQPAPRDLPEDLNVLSADEATVVAYDVSDVDDPLISFNRAMFRFNDASYRYVMIPVAKTYNRAPESVRDGIGRFFSNLKSPQLIVNHLLQAEPRKAGNSLLRFLINTTVGIAGIFDPAQHRFDLQAEETGFNATLQAYGAGRGSYIVLPLLGPADLRSTGGFLVDFFLNPVPYLTDQPATTIINSVDAEQEFAQHAEVYLKLYDRTDDSYQYFRNAYLQGRLRDEHYQTINNYLEDNH